MPPVLTKTWFHTGVDLGRDRVSKFFAELEYYREPGLNDVLAAQLLLDDTVLPDELSAEEEREACRALKGSMLRQEVYALDGTDKEKHPYTVTEQNITIRLLQPRSGNRHAVFFAHARESISYHCERNPADPRITHALTLEVDAFGNALRSVAIGYRRRDLPGVDTPEQKQTHLTLTVNRFANRASEPDWYRIGLPVETRTYEIVKPPEPTITDTPIDLFPFELIAALTTDLFPLDQPEPGAAKLWPYQKWDWHKNAANAPADTRLRLIEHVRTLYRPDDLGVARNDPLALLPLGTVEPLALPGESYKLAFTPGLLDQVYVRSGQKLFPANPADVLEGGGPDRGGYIDLDGDANWWIPSGRMFYSPGTNDTAAQELAHAHTHFFLPHRYRDPLHANQFNTETVLTYDDHRLLMIETRDALGNTAGAQNDYRVLAPRLMTDPNGNRSEVVFDALGMVAGTAVIGKAGPQTQGDNLIGFQADLTDTQVDGFYDAADPHAPAPTLLKGATTRIVYDPHRFKRTRDADPQDPAKWLPVYAATLARETHASDHLPPGGLKIQISFSYSDGFGREIQKKIQAEPGPLVDGGPIVSPRWVGSGWTVFNNKGKPVRQYEPFFSQLPEKRHRFEFGVQIGVSPVLLYDPVERVVATLHPNHTWEKVVFAPWRQETWDVNDTVLVADPKTDADGGDFFQRLPEAEYLPTWHGLRTDPAHAALFAARYPDPNVRAKETQAAEKTEIHAGTPTVAHADSLGRTFLTIAHNRFERNGALVEEKYSTLVVLDIEGNQREVIDAKDRIVMRYDYDIVGNRIHQASMEAGERWMLNDVTGKPIRAWDSRGFMRRMSYDGLRRPTGLFVSSNNVTEFLAEETVYGESQPNAELANLRGKPYQVRDGAGMATHHEYDFKGNLLKSERQLLQNYQEQVNWRQSPPLEQERFTSHTRYDALNRPVQLIAPHSDRPNTNINVIQPGYNEANFLERVDVWVGQDTEPTKLLVGNTASLHAVTNINYDAKAQRTLIQYGNGAETTYEYDKDTFRLIHLNTLHGGTALQDLRYTYDPVGNITHVRDDAQQTIYFNGQVVESDCNYSYDAIYRLIEAKGREHIGQAGRPWTTYDDAGRVNLPHPHDGQAMRNYTEQYLYDAVGNFDRLIHQAVNGNWIHGYEYNEPSLTEPTKQSNRLSRTLIHPNGQQPVLEPYTHDAHGNMVRMPHFANHLDPAQPNMHWDFEDQLHQVDLGGGGTAYCVYDAGGQRVRKMIERTGTGGAVTRIEERIYLGGFEVYREYPADRSAVALERETLHVMDDKQRIALVETRTKGDDGSAPELIRYQSGNHLGSASLELDDHAVVISYEEYYPYGSTSYQAVNKDIKAAAKRYRYTGKERDEESGLYYHGARYYAPWLGRWVSPDPEPPADTTSWYAYVNNSPTAYLDPDGRKPSPADRVRRPQRGTQNLLGGLFDLAFARFGITSRQVMRALEAEAKKEAERQKVLAEIKPTLAQWERERAYYKEHQEGLERAEARAKESARQASEARSPDAVPQSMRPEREPINRMKDSAEHGDVKVFKDFIGDAASEAASTPYVGAVVGTGGKAVKAAIQKIKILKPIVGGKFKMYWIKQEIKAAEFVWRTEGKIWRREAEIWLMKGNQMVKTQRRLDALLFDITGEIQAAEWTTAKSLSSSAKKEAQLQYQRELFAKVKEGWTVWARPAGEKAFYDITKAAERTEVYPHWQK